MSRFSYFIPSDKTILINTNNMEFYNEHRKLQNTIEETLLKNKLLDELAYFQEKLRNSESMAKRIDILLKRFEPLEKLEKIEFFKEEIVQGSNHNSTELSILRELNDSIKRDLSELKKENLELKYKLKKLENSNQIKGVLDKNKLADHYNK